MTQLPNIVVSASIAFDHIMSFNGSFKDHILVEKAHVLSVSFLIDSLKKHRGGVGGNVAYSLGLLGEPAALVGTVGEDFGEYRSVLDQHGVDTSGVVEVGGELTATGFLSADLHGNQIVSFYPGAMWKSREIDLTDAANGAVYGVVGAGDPEGMVLHTRQIAASSAKLVFDPSQQIPILTGDQLTEGIEAADIMVANDYEYSMIERKTGLSIEDIRQRVELTVVTYGEQGSEIRHGDEQVEIPIAPAREVVDPSGGGDAYRAGLLKGLLLGFDLDMVGRVAAQAATYPIENYGTQEHVYDVPGFIARFEESFPEYAGRLHESDMVAAIADRS
ncbi:MAG TPA: carbohydrate kinase family protein [Thermomicrobiales bacterium]|nr:carbohydrate kinase family protein [Thermomicrobiales bacterium]